MPKTTKSSAGEKSKEKKALIVPLEWYVPDHMTTTYATNFVVQQTGQEVILSFFEAEKPVLLGTTEQVEQELSRLKSIRAKCVARIVVTPDKIPGIIEALRSSASKRENKDAEGTA